MDGPDFSELLSEFEAGLDPANPERHPMPVRVLGYGEMSTVLAIDAGPLEQWACKRMAIFENEREYSEYATLLDRYVKDLAQVGLHMPEQRVCSALSPRTGHPVLYLMQRRVDPDTFCNSLVKGLDTDNACDLIRRILVEATKAWAPTSPGLRLGLDSQLSNWIVASPARDGWTQVELSYVDTGTPLMRVDAREQIDAELFLRTCPSSLVWIVRRFFLQDVLDRYYDFRSVAIDLVANLIKEGRPDLVGPGAEVATDVVLAQSSDATAIQEKEVKSYYREDKLIWRLFLGLRRTERFLNSTVLRKPYDVVLPGRISR